MRRVMAGGLNASVLAAVRIIVRVVVVSSCLAHSSGLIPLARTVTISLQRVFSMSSDKPAGATSAPTSAPHQKQQVHDAVDEEEDTWMSRIERTGCAQHYINVQVGGR